MVKSTIVGDIQQIKLLGLVIDSEVSRVTAQFQLLELNVIDGDAI